MNITEFKAQNPDYQDVPDVELADALHAKFYSEVPRDQFLQQIGLAGPGGNFAPTMARDDYAKQFMANNPQAKQGALDMALSQFDQQATERTKVKGNAVQDRFERMKSPEAMFNERLNERLHGDGEGVVPDLPGRQEPANAGQAIAAPSTLDTIGSGIIGGAMGTIAGAAASGARLIGADQQAAEWDQVREAIRQRQHELGGDSFTGKVSGLVGGIVPAMAAPEGVIEQLAANAGLFAIPAYQDVMKEKLAQGYSRPLAMVHAAEAFGINLLAPTVMQRGAGALLGKLASEGATGLKGAGLGLGQAAGEGVAFSTANSVLDKGTDVLAGQKNDRAWIDPEDMAVQATGFGLLRGAHMAASGAAAVGGEALDSSARARAAREAIAEITKAGSVDEAISAAQKAMDMPIDPDSVADQFLKIRPLEPVTPPEVQAPASAERVEPTLDEPATEAMAAAPDARAADGIDLTAGIPDPDAPNVWRAREPTPQRDAIDKVIDPNADWHAFPPETGTLGVPRETMPQIAAEHRGAMTQFLHARGIEHEQVEVPAESLKPTQAEFSLDKVLKAKEFEGGNRSILISSDGYVLDGHHQWLAAVDAGEPVKAIRLDAPIAKLLETVKEFPSAGMEALKDTHANEKFVTEPAARAYLTANKLGSTHRVEQTGRDEFTVKSRAGEPSGADRIAAAETQNARQDDTVRAAALALEKRKATGGERARERIHSDNPFLGFLAHHGVSTQDRADSGAERGRAGNPMVPGFGPVFRQKGLRLDELALEAKQAGFLTQEDIDSAMDTGGTRKLADMIERATQGKEVIQRVDQAEKQGPSADDELVAEAQRMGIETDGIPIDKVYDAVVAAHAERFTPQDEAVIKALDDDISLDGIAGDNLTDEDIDAIFGIKTAQPAESGSREAQGSAGSAAREGAGRGEEPGLESYSREEVIQRQEAAMARAKEEVAGRARADAADRAERDRKDIAARQDASAENFKLGQSADEALAGQKDIFDAPDTTTGGEAGKPARPGPEPARAVAAEDTGADIPLAIFKKTKVPHEVWIDDERRHETVDVPADKALASVREDIDNLRSLLRCMKG